VSAVDSSLALTDEQVTFFQENGFVGPFDLYPADDAPTMWNQAKIEMVLSANKPHNSTVINYDRHLDCDTLSAHVTQPAIVHKLRSLMGDDIICWKSNIFKKDPGEGGTGFHQVETFVVGETTTSGAPSLAYTEAPTHVSQELTVWTAFSPSDKAHGCLRFIPGSHKRWYYDESKALTFDPESKTHDFFGYDYAEIKLDADWDPEDAGPVDMEMEAGQFVIFVAKCIHGSQPNTSAEPRLGYASRYVHPSVKVFDNVEKLNEFGDEINLAYHGCVQVSGEDRYGHNRIYDRNLNGTPFGKAWP
jgi:non-heme Fe2+,alpha-ketoglutarate-dependent halogenase